MKVLIQIIFLSIYFSNFAQVDETSQNLKELYKQTLNDNSDYILSFDWKYLITDIDNVELKQIKKYEDITFLKYENLKEYLINNKISILNYLEFTHKIISKDTIDINFELKSVVQQKKNRKERKSKSDKITLSFSGCGLIYKYEPDYRYIRSKTDNWIRVQK